MISTRFEDIGIRLRMAAETTRQVVRRPSALAGGIMLVLILLTSLFFPLFYAVDPLAQDLNARFTPPAWQAGGSITYPLGADNLGRDVLSRMLYGSRVSLMVGFAAVLVAEFAGIILGLISGYYGGWVDTLLMRFVDILYSVPFIPFVIVGWIFPPW